MQEVKKEEAKVVQEEKKEPVKDTAEKATEAQKKNKKHIEADE